jgi:hypothetical protein
MVIAPHHKPPAPTIHHKKKYGGHHRVTKHYGKTYWPYLPLLLMVVFGFVLNILWSNGSGVLGRSTDITTVSLLQQTNQERLGHGENVLALNNQLSSAAQAKAEDMVARNYWSHKTPDGREPWTFVDKTDYKYGSAGENLAYGFSTGSATMSAWMNSPEHRSNILENNYSDVGFGVVSAKNFQGSGAVTVVVAFYADPASPKAATLGYKVKTAAAEIGHNVSRAQVVTNGYAAWSTAAVSIIVSFAMTIFVIRHALIMKRVLVRSEEFVIKHHHLDLLLVGVAVAGLLLSQTAGMIR